MTRVKKKLLISLVIPVYNEQEVIPELIKQLQQFMIKRKAHNFEVVFIENGSHDLSFELLSKARRKDKRFKILQLVKNVGIDGALAAGLRSTSGDAAVLVMADLQEPLEVIDSFIEKWKQGYLIVYGVVKKRTAGWHRDLAARIFYKTLNLMLDDHFPENASEFRLMDRKVYETISKMDERNAYIRGLINWTGYSHTGVPFDRQERFAGKTKQNYWTFFKVAANAIFSFSYKPLRFVSLLGISMTLLTLGLSIFYIFDYFARGRTYPGVTTTHLLIVGLFGIHFFVLGILSEYLLRVFDQVRQRPMFIVNKKLGLPN